MSESEPQQDGEEKSKDEEARTQSIYYQLLADVELEDIAAGFADNHQTSCLGSGSMTTSG